MTWNTPLTKRPRSVRPFNRRMNTPVSPSATEYCGTSFLRRIVTPGLISLLPTRSSASVLRSTFKVTTAAFGFLPEIVTLPNLILDSRGALLTRTVTNRRAAERFLFPCLLMLSR